MAKAKPPAKSTLYGRSPWIDAVSNSRVPSYPKHRAAAKTDAVIVGGGLTGCATAYAFAAAGVKVAVVEAEQIGRGSSGSSTGWIADDPGIGFLAIEQALGRRAARHTWRSWHRAALDFGALLRRLNVKCDLEARESLLLASTPEQMAVLTREQKVRRDAGVDAVTIKADAIADRVAMAASGAIRSHDGFTVDPYRAAVGLAAEAVRRGARFFEHSPARRITFGRTSVDVITAGGSIRADRVIVATGTPTALFKTLVRHFWFKASFLALTAPIPAGVRGQLGARQAIVRDSATPPHFVRWVDEVRLLVCGADDKPAPPRLREKILVQRTGQLMYELSMMYPEISGILPSHGWDSTYARSADGLPYIGPHRNYPHHLFAFGDSSPSVTGAYLASRLLLRHFLDESDPADEAFGFNRYGHVRATPTATLRRMHHDLVRITPTKMRTRCAGLLPRSTTRDTCLSATLGPLPSRTDTIRRRRLRTIRRILPSRLLQHRDPRLQQLDQHPLLTNQPLILCAQNIDPPVIVSAQIIRHTPIEPDCTRTTVDPPE